MPPKMFTLTKITNSRKSKLSKTVTEGSTTLKLRTVTMHTALQTERAMKHGFEIPV
jgi:hypothetical protein